MNFPATGAINVGFIFLTMLKSIRFFKCQQHWRDVHAVYRPFLYRNNLALATCDFCEHDRCLVRHSINFSF